MTRLRTAVLAGCVLTAGGLGASTATADDAHPSRPPHVSPLTPPPPPLHHRAQADGPGAMPEVVPPRPGPAPIPHMQPSSPGPVPMPPVGPRGEQVPLDELLPDAVGPELPAPGAAPSGR